MPLLSVQGIRKHYGDVVGVDDVSFDVDEGRFISLLGPSGCGKTTTLRAIAGLETVDEGRIYLQGQDITDEPPFRRDAALVFQNYALFPHMTVEQNVAFGLRMSKVVKREARKRVAWGLELVQLGGYGQRYPRELSGGQQQRIALARALAVGPALLLLDEPLSNLDAKLREEMRIEMKQIQHEVGITTVFVTHDQEEAMTLSDTVVVMDRGRIVEMGGPADIYQNPQSEFTARFIGNANLLLGEVKEIEGDEIIAWSNNGSGLRIRASRNPDVARGDEVLIAFKHERVRLSPTSVEANSAAAGLAQNISVGTVRLVTFHGPSIQYVCDMEGHQIIARRANERDPLDLAPGDSVVISWAADDVTIIPRR